MASGEFNREIVVGNKLACTQEEINKVCAGVLSGSVAWDPGSIGDGNEEAKEVTVAGAVLGDFVLCSFSLDVTDLVLRGAVTAANTVTAILANNTGGAIDLGAGTLRALVIKNN